MKNAWILPLLHTRRTLPAHRQPPSSERSGSCSRERQEKERKTNRIGPGLITESSTQALKQIPNDLTFTPFQQLQTSEIDGYESKAFSSRKYSHRHLVCHWKSLFFSFRFKLYKLRCNSATALSVDFDLNDQIV